MVNLEHENNLSSSQQGPVFRRRIDDKKRTQPGSDQRYGTSALSYSERQAAMSQSFDQHNSMLQHEGKKANPMRWQQNYSTQDLYLGYCVSEGLIVDILMKNDSTRQGRIESYDNWSLLISYEGKKSLLFKSGVMAITASDRDETRNKDYFGAQHLSDFSSDYSHNPA